MNELMCMCGGGWVWVGGGLVYISSQEIKIFVCHMFRFTDIYFWFNAACDRMTWYNLVEDVSKYEDINDGIYMPTSP